MMDHVKLRSGDGRTVILAGGILGLAEEAKRVHQFLQDHPVERVLLGIPFEDLDAIKATREHHEDGTFEKDPVDEMYVDLLARYGPVQVPPGDLYAAFEHARSKGVPVDAIDLGDEGHSDIWAKKVGIFELMRNNRRLKRLDQLAFEAPTARGFADEWDQALFPSKGLRAVQDEREAWMGRRIADLSKGSKAVFALVPLARMKGVRDQLIRGHGFKDG